MGLAIDYKGINEGKEYPIEVIEKGLKIRCVNLKKAAQVDDVLSYLRGKMEREAARTGKQPVKDGRYQYIESERYVNIILEDFDAYIEGKDIFDENEEGINTLAYSEYMGKKFPDYDVKLEEAFDDFLGTIFGTKDEGNGPND